MPLPDVKASVVRKVMEFCEHNLANKMPEIEKPLRSADLKEVVPQWYADFVSVDQVSGGECAGGARGGLCARSVRAR